MSFIGNFETLRRNCVPHLNIVFVNQPLFCTIVSLVTRYIHAKLNCADINQSGDSGTYKYKIIHV